MPPGSKKRKAAKKKQEQEASSTQINLKSNNHDSPKKSNEEQDTIRIEKDTDERIVITDSSHDHDKSSSNNSSSSSSSSSSSDDESKEVKKKDDSVSEVVTVTSVPNQALPIAGDAPFMGSTANAIVENTGLIDSVTTPSDLISEEQHIEISPVETIIENVAEPIEITTEAKTSPPPLQESNVVVPEVIISHNEEEVTVGPTHGIAERTSWFSCCGLFDVVTGSSR